MYSATYSPEDNKLRLYASSRLDAELYARVKSAGFSWAPKQALFVAPMWTPGREDLLLELCGDIEDEDKSLVERQEERAERFEEYSEKRETDANRARDYVSSIADNIPFGQPILVGHHSERHARKDAERIENGMRKAVKMWETSKYWESRAAGAIAHAKYKELPAVRARRIKGLEADKRKQERAKAESEKFLALWTKEGLTEEQAKAIANISHLVVTFKNADGTQNENSGWTAYDVLRPDGDRYRACPSKTVAECQEAARQAYPRHIARCDRWINHYSNRLAYERAMLSESGGLVSDRQKFEVGGRVLRRGEWLTILKVNAQSVTVSSHWSRTCTFDEIKDYQTPTPEQTAAITKAFKTPPLCNYPGEGFRHMTKAELDAESCRQWSDFPKTMRIKPTETHGAHRVQQTRAKQWDSVGVYVTDKKRVDPPLKDTDAPTIPKPERAETVRQEQAKPEASTDFDAMKETLKTGVQVAVAPQLFPTPRDIAQRMADMADIQPGTTILEPSAGTGMLLGACGGRMFGPNAEHGLIDAVEINRTLADKLEHEFPYTKVHCDDFMTIEPASEGNAGLIIKTLQNAFYDVVLMNPPFINGSDIKHIQHARKFLKSGGRLIAICANGPRQNEILKPLASSWEVLPRGTFSGTDVSTVLLTID